MSGTITIYQARKIITMSPHQPFATHVAVRDGHILGAGSLEELEGWGDYTLDTTFADKVLMPGMIEGHAHSMEGSVWQDNYVGYYERTGPDGKKHKALKSIDEVVEHLQGIDAEMSDPDEPLMCWGFDPIYFEGRRMEASDLDRVSTTRPVLIVHASFHIANVNTAVLTAANITASTNIQGIVKGKDGNPTGELQGMPAQFMAGNAIGRHRWGEMGKVENLWRFARSAQLAGVTTTTDLANPLEEEVIVNLKAVTAKDDYPLRIVPAFMGNTSRADDGVKKITALIPESSNKLRFGLIKLVADGSIQGFTARMMDPGYYNGAPNGLWYIDPDEIQSTIETYHAAGLQVHIHTNGDQATDHVLGAIETTLKKHPDPDARFTLQHCQMAHESHYQRMARLGVGANLFSNHLFYWGDQHYEQTMGPERAARMNATGTAKRLGVFFSIHSDAPITPLAPLFTAWCAANRISMTGREIGPAEKIGLHDALYAVTMGAAYTLKLDDELGSIEVGKRADFAVLEDDPYELGAEGLKDVRVWGTVMDGKIYNNADI